jgi:hypothetical protein
MDMDTIGRRFLAYSLRFIFLFMPYIIAGISYYLTDLEAAAPIYYIIDVLLSPVERFPLLIEISGLILMIISIIIVVVKTSDYREKFEDQLKY